MCLMDSDDFPSCTNSVREKGNKRSKSHTHWHKGAYAPATALSELTSLVWFDLI